MKSFLVNQRRGWSAALAGLLLAAGLGGCGGGGTGAGGTGHAASAPDTAAATALAPQARTATGGGGITSTAFNGGVTDPGLLMLLLPDNVALTDGRISGWTEAAVELGVRMAPITDAQFLAMGVATQLKYGGLVLPDDLHTLATDAVVAAVRNYVTQGGRAMLTFDFGALTTTDTGVPVYPVPKSRLSDLAGVDYVLYDELRDRTTGLGPVTGMRSVFRQLQVPPGKSMPYAATGSGALAPQAAAIDGTATDAARPGGARYLPVSVADPGGVRGFDPQQFQQVRMPTVRERLEGRLRARVPIDYGRAIVAAPVTGATRAQPQTAAALDAALARGTALAPQAATLAADSLDALSGYLVGALTYASYVTRGDFAGLTLATSPQFGLVAGVNTVGTGQVLFVNMPLTYLKGRTDGMPLHGFLGYFVHRMGLAPYVSPMPNGIAGLTLNWHLDSMAAQTPTLALEQMGIFNAGRFSVHMTAGPDTIQPGDGLGWNLNNNTVAQDLLRRLDAIGQDVGSHGGWIHDYYGDNASETNATEFLPYLQMNQQAVDGLLGKPARSYSAPEGNNPKWAMDWLEQQGVEGAYFLGHTGLGPTRHFRDGQLLNPKLYVFPVTPQGLYATFEEWQFFNVPKADVTAWYHDLVDFAIQNDTSRMVYMHPPGAYAWSDVLQDLVTYAAAKGGAQYRWYTMASLANAMQKRLKISWTQAVLADGSTRFDASHPNNLASIVWKLPKTRYQKPTVSVGTATVADGGSFWLVKATGGKTLQFTAKRV